MRVIIIMIWLSFSSVFAQEKHTLDLNRSTAFWKGRIFGGMHGNEGTIKFSAGEIALNSKGEPYHASFVIDMESIKNTNLKEPNQQLNIEMDLKSDKFFDSKRYPKGYFKSTQIRKNGAGEYSVQGDLTIKGISKPIVIKVKLTNNMDGLKASSDFTFYRSRWGVNLSTPNVLYTNIGEGLIAEEVPMSFQMVFAK
jgi:polyisoprenoid-binding protein YceI